MRIVVVLGILLALLLPRSLQAQTIPISTVRLSHSVLTPGQAETLAVLARDLAGHPLAGASVRVTVHYGSRVQAYRLHPTDANGRTSITFRPPGGMTRAKARVDVSIANGYLSINLKATFAVGQALGGRPALPSATSTAATTAQTAAAGQIVAVARALPPDVTAPNPAWIAVYARQPSGAAVTSAEVDAIAQFHEGAVHVQGITDGSGVATLRIDTAQVAAPETVQVTTEVTHGAAAGSAVTSFTVAPAPTATPTPTLPPTATPVPTPAPVIESPDRVLGSPQTPTPTPTNTPTATNTPRPTSTPTPTDTPVPTNTPVPTPTSTPAFIIITPGNQTGTTTTSSPGTTGAAANCPGSQSGCIQAMLNMINQSRAQGGFPPLTLNMTQTNGTASCVGSYGHSVHMAQAGGISHDQFPADVCIPYMIAGENVGRWPGNELAGLQAIHSGMMSEPYTPGCAIGSHVCNIMSPQFHQVGIGIYDANDTVWLTEDFTD